MKKSEILSKTAAAIEQLKSDFPIAFRVGTKFLHKYAKRVVSVSFDTPVTSKQELSSLSTQLKKIIGKHTFEVAQDTYDKRLLPSVSCTFKIRGNFDTGLCYQRIGSMLKNRYSMDALKLRLNVETL